jgi:hypothetical protein
MSNEPADVEEGRAYTVKITGPGVNVEQAVTQETAVNLIGIALRGLSPVLPSGGSPVTSLPMTSTPGTRLSLREYLDDVNARKNPEKILAIADYLTRINTGGQKETVTREEVRGAYKLAGEPVPANLPRDFLSTQSLGWIAADPRDPDGYYVTRKGKQSLDNRFEGVTTTPIRRRRKTTNNGDSTQSESETGDNNE